MKKRWLILLSTLVTPMFLLGLCNRSADPHQLTNTISTLASTQESQLQSYLDNLEMCANGSCQSYEE